MYNQNPRVRDAQNPYRTGVLIGNCWEDKFGMEMANQTVSITHPPLTQPHIETRLNRHQWEQGQVPPWNFNRRLWEPAKDSRDDHGREVVQGLQRVGELQPARSALPLVLRSRTNSGHIWKAWFHHYQPYGIRAEREDWNYHQPQQLLGRQDNVSQQDASQQQGWRSPKNVWQERWIQRTEHAKTIQPVHGQVR